MLEYSARRARGADQRADSLPTQSRRNGVGYAASIERQLRSSVHHYRAIGGLGGDGLPGLRLPAAGQIQAVGGEQSKFQSHPDVFQLRYRADRVQRLNFAAKASAVITTLLIALAVMPAAKAVEIDVNKGQIDPLPIAITAFVGASPDAARA